MCGIAGIVWSKETEEPLAIRLDRMRDVMAARGPDDAHTVVFDGLRSGLAARRLSIIDLAGGRQPIPNEDASVHAVLNGEIYNHHELRQQLESKGHRFRSHCDTEVLVHLYEEYGEDLFGEFHGMFALAIFDSHQRRLLLGRDGPGMKPLYYADTSQGFLFASEIKALLASGMVPAEPDLEALNVSLGTGLVPAPMCGFRGIRKLLPGGYVVCTGRALREGAFWRYRHRTAEIPRTEPARAEELERRLETAAGSHLAANVTVGALVSGGWDSSLTATMAAAQISSPLKTYSVVFPEDPHTDESRYSRELTRRLRTDHTEVEYRTDDYIDSHLDIIRAMEEPLSTLPASVFWKLYSGAGELKTVLSGEGSDELFARLR